MDQPASKFFGASQYSDLSLPTTPSLSTSSVSYTQTYDQAEEGNGVTEAPNSSSNLSLPALSRTASSASTVVLTPRNNETNDDEGDAAQIPHTYYGLGGSDLPEPNTINTTLTLSGLSSGDI